MAKAKTEAADYQPPKKIWTALQLAALKPIPGRTYQVADRDTKGLRCYVSPTGTKSWVWFFAWKGAQLKLTIGPVSLADARIAAAAARVDVSQGIDPRDTKKVAKAIMGQGKAAPPAARPAKVSATTAPAAAPAADAGTVEAVVAAYIEQYAKPKKRTWAESQRLLRKDVLPAFAGRAFASISTDDWQDLIDAIGDRAPIMGNRVHAELSSLCKWAASRRVKLAPANAFMGVERPVASEKSRARKRFLTDAELATVWRASDLLAFPFSQIVKLLALTGQRRNEVARMERRELDFDKAIWSLPPARTKNKEAHDVPLAPAAVAILRAVPRFARRPGQSDFVFGLAPPRSFSDAKMNIDKAIVKLTGKPIEDWQFHDLRRTCSTGMAKLGVLPHVREAVLNHIGGFKSGVAGVYDRHDYAPEMRKALELWANHIDSIVNDSEPAEAIKERENA